MPKFCSECGSERSPSAKFCGDCGSEFQSHAERKTLVFESLEEKKTGTSDRNSFLRPRVSIPVGLVLGLGILWFLFSSVWNSPEAQLARCIDEGDHSLVAKRTNYRLDEMNKSLNEAAAYGELAPYYAVNSLNKVYGPAFVSLGQDWGRLDECDSSVIGPLQKVISQELIDLGAILKNIEAGDGAEFDRAIQKLENIGDSVLLLSAYLESQ